MAYIEGGEEVGCWNDCHQNSKIKCIHLHMASERMSQKQERNQNEYQQNTKKINGFSFSYHNTGYV